MPVGSQRKLYADLIGEALRNHCWTQLKAGLGLARCEQADYFIFPNPEGLLAKIPALMIVYGRTTITKGPELPALSTPYPYELHLLRAIPLNEQPSRSLTQDIETVAELFLQGNFKQPSISQPGLVINSITTTEFGLLPSRPLLDFEILLGHASARVVVEAESHPIPV